MRIALVLSLFLVIIFISGCVEQDDEVIPVYYDEALKMEAEVTGRVLPAQAIRLKVDLTNQVEKDVRDVDLIITDLYGLEPILPDCAGGEVRSNYHCYFGSIASLDDKEINFVLKIPTKEELARIGRELKPELTLEYTYDGETTFLIPILGPNERTTDAKSQLIQSKGPIHVDIKRGFSESNEEWERDGSGFSILMTAEDVSSLASEESDITIDNDNFIVTLTNMEHNPSFGRCDFVYPWTDISPDVYQSEPLEEITLPMKVPLVCALEGRSGGMPWVYGRVTVNYDNYRYRGVEEKSIEVETVIV